MVDLEGWIDAYGLIKMWEVEREDLGNWIRDLGLVAYDTESRILGVSAAHETGGKWAVGLKIRRMLEKGELKFRLEDALRFENDHPELCLGPNYDH